ncbi:hypothetical protein [Domibacillus mangrovi]|uniref:Uncharacterized protein n=1 Tax=Domibacillus mangrovi TaxID=1714354 RepID=A0A1Q5P3E2_9BACI|nr:hypothetical protein [Domibacillus mangrovi]OKL36764.1 hypothetical protein BLL40_08515 [Domibacillus mangrovi]
MLPIELFGWILSMILGVIFICSLVALYKEPTSDTEKENTFTPSTISEDKIKERPTVKIY